MTITEQLIKGFFFQKISKSEKENDKIDIDQFSCILRIHEIH